MWLKCGTKIRNEINELKKSIIFFGSGIYPKISYCQFHQRVSVLRCDPLNQHPCPRWGRFLRCKGGFKRLQR